MSFFNFKRVLCISPHPDDIEYGMAGSILRFSDVKFDVLCLSCGGDFDDSTSHKRLEEMDNFWKKSGCKNVTPYHSQYTMLKELGVDSWINYIETNFVNKNNYDAIFVPPQTQFDSHFEHGIVSSFSRALVRVKPISIIEFCTPSTLDTWIPNIYVNISETYITKVKLLKTFKSQRGKAYFKKEMLDAFHFHYQPVKRGIAKTERYKILQWMI